VNAALEKVEPDDSDPEYLNRSGYDADFLGFNVPLPRLTNVVKGRAFALPDLSGDAKYELKYHHYSLLFNKLRKLAFVAGFNVDPTAQFHHPRVQEGTKWYFDPRVSADGEFQAGEGLYAGNRLDRGHLVRTVDAGWGATAAEAKLASGDSFHFTNCLPQHEITNQGKLTEAPAGLKLWGKLEDHIALEGKRNKRRLCVFNGPVFRRSDQMQRGVKIPKEFWKLVVFADDAGEPAAAAFLLTQAQLIQGLEEELDPGEYKTVQVRIKDVEVKTHLDFGPIRHWDVIEREGTEERFTGGLPAVIIESVDDVVM
jgi:endonuclease G